MSGNWLDDWEKEQDEKTEELARYRENKPTRPKRYGMTGYIYELDTKKIIAQIKTTINDQDIDWQNDLRGLPQ